MPSKAYDKGYQKAKFYNKGGKAAYYQEGDEVSAADQISADRGNVEQLPVAFETDVEGQTYQFNKAFNPPPDLAEFYPEDREKVPTQGDMVASTDGFLYAYAGDGLGKESEGLEIGWYRSKRQFHGGPAPSPTE